MIERGIVNQVCDLRAQLVDYGLEWRKVWNQGTEPLRPGALDMAQIAERGYVDPYRQRGKPIYSIGVAFGREERGIVDWQVVETA